MKLATLQRKNHIQYTGDSYQKKESGISLKKHKLNGLDLYPDPKNPRRQIYLYHYPAGWTSDEHYEPESIEIEDTGLSSEQTMRLLNIDENRLRYLLRHGPLWRVPSFGEDGKPRRFRRISIKSIIDYLRMQNEPQLKKFADYWEL